jgi:5-methylcytosine-specific restriction endonuclease McrA
MRSRCPRCGCIDGIITTKNGQDTVRWAECDRFCYNAPRSETGRDPRSLRSRPQIRPSQRVRIFEYDNWTCVVCRAQDVPLQIGHFVSVDDQEASGISDAERYDDENLVTVCAECNAGQGAADIFAAARGSGLPGADGQATPRGIVGASSRAGHKLRWAPAGAVGYQARTQVGQTGISAVMAFIAYAPGKTQFCWYNAPL